MISVNQSNQFIDNLKQILTTSEVEFAQKLSSIQTGNQNVALIGKGTTPDEAKFVAEFYYNQFKKYLHHKKADFKLVNKKYALSRNDLNQFVCSLTIQVIMKDQELQ